MPENKPIFIVGSPRSGTSILTWCLGQHSNIFVQEESNWMGPLALQIEIAYRIGTARAERSQLSALGVRREDFFAVFGEAADSLILSHRERLEARIRAHSEAKRMLQREKSAGATESASSGAFRISRSASDPKTRWVDGSPEYSFYIHALREFFAQARFIHIVRDAASVVRSMLNFERTGGPPIVAGEQHAYGYWLRTVRACFEAERALGPEIVRRLRHSDLVDKPEESIRSLLQFLGEPFEPACLEPLQTRINSSEVPQDFAPPGAKTALGLTEEVTRLNADMEGPAPSEADPEAAAKMAKAFDQQVNDVMRLPSENRDHLKRIRALQEELKKARAGK